MWTGSFFFWDVFFMPFKTETDKLLFAFSTPSFITKIDYLLQILLYVKVWNHFHMVQKDSRIFFGTN